MALRRSAAVHYLQFAIAGAVAFVCEYAGFLILYYRFHQPVIIANSISFTLGLTLSFLLNRFWVFRSGSHSAAKQFILFAALASANLILTNLLLVILKRYGIAPAVGKLLLMAIPWNFLILRNQVFVSRTSSFK